MPDNLLKSPLAFGALLQPTRRIKTNHIYRKMNGEKPLRPIILTSPHSGRHMPSSFLNQINVPAVAIRTHLEDPLVDQLYGFAPKLGITFLNAAISRGFVDLNREPLELDPMMFDGILKLPVNNTSQRVGGGIGVIPRKLNDGRDIYNGVLLSPQQAFHRLRNYHTPYHKVLHAIISKHLKEFPRLLLVDCHSMPSDCSYQIEGNKRYPVDFVISDNFGKTCNNDLSDFVISFLKHKGYRVSYNHPFAGGFTVRHYKHIYPKLNTLQIEVRRNLYIDERTLQPNNCFSRTQQDLKELLTDLPVN